MICKKLIPVGFLVAILAPLPTLAQAEGVLPAQEQILGVPSAIEGDRPEFIWLERGTKIRQSAEWQSPVIAIVDFRVQVPVAQEQGTWLLVRYAGWKGWVHPAGEEEPAPAVPFTTAPDQVVLDRALKILGDRAGAAPIPGPRRLGPFSLFTDVTESKLLDFLDTVTSSLPSAYADRYDLDPGDQTLEAVVIFSREEDYRAFTRTTTDAPGFASGHATQGMAVAFVGDQTRDEVAAVLVHELTHLLNRRVFRDLELPWLDEGMSNDLAYCHIRRRTGELELGTLGGSGVVIEHPVYLAGGESRIDREVRLEGPVAALSLLRDNHELMPLGTLLDLQPLEFMDPLGLRARYDQSAFFIRFLLDPENGGMAQGFRSYLQRLAEAGSDDMAGEITAHLGHGFEELDLGFEGWLRSRSHQSWKARLFGN